MFECGTGLDLVFQLGLLVFWGVVLRLVARKDINKIAVRHYKTIIQDCAMEGLPVLDMTDAVQFRRSASAELPSR